MRTTLIWNSCKLWTNILFIYLDLVCLFSSHSICFDWEFNPFAAKSLQSCLTLCNPIDGSPPGSPIPGILQARTLSGLPFPSPMHESEKWKWSHLVVSDPQRPHGPQPSRLLHPWDFPGKSTGVGCHCLIKLHVNYWWGRAFYCHYTLFSVCL